MRTIWFVGNDENKLTSICEIVGEELINRDQFVELIVHGEVKDMLGKGLTVTQADKSVFADRLGFLGNLLHRNNIFALVISNEATLEDRKEIKKIYGNYFQVNLDSKDELTDIEIKSKEENKLNAKIIIDFLVKEKLIPEKSSGANIYSKDEEEEIRRRLEELGYV